jgi:pimeloyl-ACP methyl ester carboxylesterase
MPARAPVRRVAASALDTLAATSDLVSRGARTALSPRTARAVALEAAWLTGRMAVYPWGLLREHPRGSRRLSLQDLPPVQRGLLIGDVEAAGTPIVLVHGMIDNRTVFSVMRRGLRRRGFDLLTAINYSPVTNDVRAAARLLSAEVESLVADTGYERVHVIGHSLGGLIARYFVQRLGGDARVHTLVTMGTPHGGSRIARLLPAELGRQLRPGSDLVRELAGPAKGCRTRFVAYWSDLDQMISPKSAARVEHPDLRARNVLVRGCGHMSLPIDGRVVTGVSSALSHLDADGGVVTAGVTTLST